MKHNISSFIGGLLGVLVLSLNAAHATPTRVGNGDDGTDLESTKKVESGILIETRADAMARVAKLNAQNVPGLGRLLVEIEKSEILLVSRDVKPTAEKIKVVGDVIDVDRAQGLRGMEHDGDTVFARTFPEPVAPTRFFPGALTLDREQLIALHIHEALHRALPEDLREDEGIVSSLTLALAAPDSTHDRVQAAMAKVLYTNRFARSGGDGAVSAAPMLVTANTQVEKTSDFWNVNYDKSEIQTRATMAAGGEPKGSSKIEFLPKVYFAKIGPLTETTFEPYVSAAIGSVSNVPLSQSESGPIGARLATRVWESDGSKVFLEYRFTSGDSASQSIKRDMMARPIKEYGVRYISKPSTVQWTHFVSVIEGSGSRYDYRGYEQSTPDEFVSLVEYNVSVDRGSAALAKTEAAIHVLGESGGARGLFIVPSIELIFLQPSNYEGTYFSGFVGPSRQSESVTKMIAGGLDVFWRSESMKFGLGFKYGGSSDFYGGIAQMGDYWEHRHRNASIAANVTFTL